MRENCFASEKLLATLAVSHCGVVLLGDVTANLSPKQYVEGAPELGASINIDQEPISQQLIRNKEVDVFDLETGDEHTMNFTKSFSIPETKTLIFLPIIVREKTAGFFSLEDTSGTEILILKI